METPAGMTRVLEKKWHHFHLLGVYPIRCTLREEQLFPTSPKLNPKQKLTIRASLFFFTQLGQNK